MEITPDFRTMLRERTDEEGGRFEQLTAGDFRVSIQSPDAWLLDRLSTRAPEDCDYWEVTLHGTDGALATPSTHPRLFRDELWRRYWSDGPQASRMPTEVVQTFFDFLVLGPEPYGEAISRR